MTEQEYVDATNLAKLRTAKTILHDCLPMRPEEEAFELAARIALSKWINYLEPVVAIDPDESPVDPTPPPQSSQDVGGCIHGKGMYEPCDRCGPESRSYYRIR